MSILRACILLLDSLPLFAATTLLCAAITATTVTAKKEAPDSVYHSRNDSNADDCDSPILQLHNYISQRVT